MAPKAVQVVHDPRVTGDLLPPLNFDGRMIEVEVGEGEEAKSVTLHEHALRSHSLFFDAALGHEWKESKEAKVKLPKEEMRYFKVWAQWIYTNRISDKELVENSKSRYYPLPALPALYCLGSTLLDLAFQDAMLDCIIAQTYKRVTGRDQVTFHYIGHMVLTIYRKTPGSDPARRLTVDLHVKDAGEDMMRQAVGPEFVEFLRDLVCALIHHKKAKTEPIIVDKETGTCAYHHHGDKPCYSGRKKPVQID